VLVHLLAFQAQTVFYKLCKLESSCLLNRLVQGDSGSLLLDAITVTLCPSLALVDHSARCNLENHPGSTLAAWYDWLEPRLQSLFDAAASWTFETIERHGVPNLLQPSAACQPYGLRCVDSSCTHRRSESLARCHACTDCNTARERRLGACPIHGCRQACRGVRSPLCSTLCAVGDLCLSDS